MIRGGSWEDIPWNLRSAGRNWSDTDYRYNGISPSLGKTTSYLTLSRLFVVGLAEITYIFQ